MWGECLCGELCSTNIAGSDKIIVVVVVVECCCFLIIYYWWQGSSAHLASRLREMITFVKILRLAEVK